MWTSWIERGGFQKGYVPGWNQLKCLIAFTLLCPAWNPGTVPLGQKDGSYNWSRIEWCKEPPRSQLLLALYCALPDFLCESNKPLNIYVLWKSSFFAAKYFLNWYNHVARFCFINVICPTSQLDKIQDLKVHRE